MRRVFGRVLLPLEPSRAAVDSTYPRWTFSKYQGKQLFAKHDVPVPEGRPAGAVDEAVEAAEELGYPVVIKAQVQIGGRGNAGLRPTRTPFASSASAFAAQVSEIAEEILGTRV